MTPKLPRYTVRLCACPEIHTYTIETSGGPWVASVQAIKRAHDDGLEHVDVYAVEEVRQ